MLSAGCGVPRWGHQYSRIRARYSRVWTMVFQRLDHGIPEIGPRYSTIGGRYSRMRARYSRLRAPSEILNCYESFFHFGCADICRVKWQLAATDNDPIQNQTEGGAERSRTAPSPRGTSMETNGSENEPRRKRTPSMRSGGDSEKAPSRGRTGAIPSRLGPDRSRDWQRTASTE